MASLSKSLVLGAARDLTIADAAAKSGLLSKRWAVAGPMGAALLVGSAMTTPAVVDGSPTFFVGVAGFAVWVAFVIRTAVALLRSRDI